MVPNDSGLRTRLLTEAHDAGTAGHSGIASTKDRLATRVHWAGLASDVHDYVASCDSCQRNKVEQRRTAGLLRPPPVPDEPGYAINIDFVFGLPRTERGHTGYLSMTCRLSNWLEPGLCSDNITAEGAAQLVFDRWVRTFGLPAASSATATRASPAASGVSSGDCWTPSWTCPQPATRRRTARLRIASAQPTRCCATMSTSSRPTGT